MSWAWSNIDWDKSLTVGVGAATLVQAAVAVMMVRGLRHSRRAADAATAAIDLARETSVRQLRAYLEVSEAELQGDRNGGVVKILFKNSGQTPAYRIRTRAQVMIGPPNTMDAWEFPEPESAPTQGVMGAGGISTLFQPIAAEQLNGNIAALQNGEVTVGIAIELRYADTFGIERRLTARRQLVPTLHATHLAATSRGDEAD